MRTILAALGAAAVAVMAMAEGTVTTSVRKLGHVNRVAVSWASTTNNSASGTIGYIRGEIARVETYVGTSLIPSNSYDVTLTDEAGVDVLAGLGANQATNTAQSFVPMETARDGGAITTAVPFAVNDLLMFEATGTGTNRAGTLVLYVK